MSEISNSDKKYYSSSSVFTDFEAFTWKIPNISSIPHIIDHVVQSPSFNFGGFSWILKMYPYGQTAKSEGYINVILEEIDMEQHINSNQTRLMKIFSKESVVEIIDVEQHIDSKQYYLIQIFCEDGNGRIFWQREGNCNFFPTQIPALIKLFKLTKTLKGNPEAWKLAPNDTLRIVCSFRKDNQQNSQATLDEKHIGKRFERSEIPEVGEILKEYSAYTVIETKISNIEPVPVGYQIREPEQFQLADASWVLKIHPYFRMENSENKNFDVVLERLHSKITEHNVLLDLFIEPSDGKPVEKAFYFNANHTQGDVCNIEYDDSEEMYCLNYIVTLRMKNFGHESDSQKSLQPKGSNSASGHSAVIQKSNFLQNFKKLYLQQEDCDINFNVKGKEFSAHKLIVKSQYPVLASAFQIDMKEKGTGMINIEDCEPDIFSDFLCYLYCAEASLSKHNVFSLFTIADKYGVSDLRAMCMEFINKNLSVDTFCDAIALALLHSEAVLIKLCTDFFAKNLQEIIVTVQWQSFILQNPIQVNELMIKALVRSEKDRF